jgi:hypothetical protein
MLKAVERQDDRLGNDSGRILQQYKGLPLVLYAPRHYGPKFRSQKTRHARNQALAAPGDRTLTPTPARGDHTIMLAESRQPSSRMAGTTRKTRDQRQRPCRWSNLADRLGSHRNASLIKQTPKNGNSRHYESAANTMPKCTELLEVLISSPVRRDQPHRFWAAAPFGRGSRSRRTPLPVAAMPPS